ncbi:MAG: MerR family transcriptional regulator [Acidimicrobiia bacterium]|nr:MerR family transcriptional regulator [Acidimicrobiia bacterium]
MQTRLYPIRAVSKLTGISIDTLRAWERRYRVVTPQRDARGRLYTEADVQRLRLLNAGVEKGHAIGRLAALSDEELKGLMTSPVTVAEARGALEAIHPDLPSLVPQAVMAAIDHWDYAAAERELALLAAVLAPRELVYRVALPLMRRIGEAWHAGQLTIAQEHMTSALVRNLVGALIPLYRRSTPTSKLLFATPGGEQHEFGILLSAMLAAGGGLDIVYLGANLPAEEIVAAARRTAPQAVVLGFIGSNGTKAGLKELQEVAQKLPAQIELWVGGTQGEDVVKEVKKTRALLIGDFEMLEQHLIRLGARF